jgi:hypothetical protein
MKSRLMTCRFCKKRAYAPSAQAAGFIKYGVRHYACRLCYVENKTLADARRDRTLANILAGG